MIGRMVGTLRRVLNATPSVPVLVYHSVGPDNGHPVWGPLTLPVEVFDAQLAWLRRAGYDTVSLYQLHAHLAHGAPLPEKPIVLTFDDGFLDTWVYVCPLLEHYGLQGTLFLCPAFIQEGEGIRPRAERTAAGGWTRPEEWWGYMRWDEARAMAATGALDIQGHALTHHRYFAGPRIVDYLRPGTPHYWCRWLTHPDRQPYWLTESFVDESEYGTPVYEPAEALLAPRYEPDPRLCEHTRAFVADRGGAAFFDRPGWRAQLDEAAKTFRDQHGDRGTLESQEDYLQRARHELTESRAVLKRELGKDVDFLCWPCDEHNDTVHQLALECGFTATTTLLRPNAPGADPTRIGRTYWGQSDEAFRAGRPWLMYLKFQATVQFMRGRRLAYPKLFLVNRLVGWYDHPGRRRREWQPA